MFPRATDLPASDAADRPATVDDGPERTLQPTGRPPTQPTGRPPMITGQQLDQSMCHVCGVELVLLVSFSCLASTSMKSFRDDLFKYLLLGIQCLPNGT
mmetsp:Transcript_29948/g.87458  ORF Transcript_29948/g.87458 Transcript_29948/m.87458 type:complete len:99 (-) Transcript_29948:1171-1467(-)